MPDIANIRCAPQDADFIEMPDETSSKKKKNKKKDKKDRKRKQREELEDQEIEAVDGLSLEQRKEKLKSAVDEYQNLDHEDMVSAFSCCFRIVLTFDPDWRPADKVQVHEGQRQ